jgi:hypothetical protein
MATVYHLRVSASPNFVAMLLTNAPRLDTLYLDHPCDSWNVMSNLADSRIPLLHTLAVTSKGPSRLPFSLMHHLTRVELKDPAPSPAQLAYYADQLNLLPHFKELSVHFAHRDEETWTEDVYVEWMDQTPPTREVARAEYLSNITLYGDWLVLARFIWHLISLV